jgi:hypothetical protein
MVDEACLWGRLPSTMGSHVQEPATAASATATEILLGDVWQMFTEADGLANRLG